MPAVDRTEQRVERVVRVARLPLADECVTGGRPPPEPLVTAGQAAVGVDAPPSFRQLAARDQHVHVVDAPGEHLRSARRRVQRHRRGRAADADRDVPARARAAAAPDLEEQLAAVAPVGVPEEREISVVDGHIRDPPETAIDPQHGARLQIRTDGDDLVRALSIRGRPKEALGPPKYLHGLLRGSTARELADDAKRDHRRRSSRACVVEIPDQRCGPRVERLRGLRCRPRRERQGRYG